MIKQMLMAVLMAASMTVSAKPFAHAALPAGTQVVLDDEQGDCPATFKKAHVLFQGRELKACWTERPGDILIRDEEGDQGIIPKVYFKPLTDI